MLDRSKRFEEIYVEITGMSIEEVRTLPIEEGYRRLESHTGKSYPLPIDTTPTIDSLPLMTVEEQERITDGLTRKPSKLRRLINYFSN